MLFLMFLQSLHCLRQLLELLYCHYCYCLSLGRLAGLTVVLLAAFFAAGRWTLPGPGDRQCVLCPCCSQGPRGRRPDRHLHLAVLVLVHFQTFYSHHLAALGRLGPCNPLNPDHYRALTRQSPCPAGRCLICCC